MSAAREPAPRPLRRDARRNRQRILDATRTLVSDRGLAVSHEQIAVAADVAVGTVYRHFPVRSVLIEEALAEHVETVVDAARAAEFIEDPWAALVAFMEAGLESRVRNQGLHELIGGTGEASAIATQSRQRIAPVATRIVARCQEAGVMRADVDVYDLALVPTMIAALGHRARKVDPDLWRRYLMIVLDGFRPNGSPLPGKPLTPADVDRVTGSHPGALIEV